MSKKETTLKNPLTMEVTLANGVFTPTNANFVKESLPEGLTLEHIDNAHVFIDQVNAAYSEAAYTKAKELNFAENYAMSALHIGDHIVISGNITPESRLETEIKQLNMALTAAIIGKSQEDYKASNVKMDYDDKYYDSKKGE